MLVLVLSFSSVACTPSAEFYVTENSAVSSNSGFVPNNTDAYVLKTDFNTTITLLRNNTYSFEKGDPFCILSSDLMVPSNYVYCSTDDYTIYIGQTFVRDSTPAFTNIMNLYGIESTSDYQLLDEVVEGRELFCKDSTIKTSYVYSPVLVKDNDTIYEFRLPYVRLVAELPSNEYLVIYVTANEDDLEEGLASVSDITDKLATSKETKEIEDKLTLVLEDLCQYILIGDYSDEYNIIDLPLPLDERCVPTYVKYYALLELDCGCTSLVYFDEELNLDTAKYFMKDTCTLSHNVSEVSEDLETITDIDTGINYPLYIKENPEYIPIVEDSIYDEDGSTTLSTKEDEIGEDEPIVIEVFQTE